MTQDARHKATSTRKDISSALAQVLAVAAMLVIAGFAFFARGNAPVNTAMTVDRKPTPAVFTEGGTPQTTGQLSKQNAGFTQRETAPR